MVIHPRAQPPRPAVNTHLGEARVFMKLSKQDFWSLFRANFGSWEEGR